MSGVQTIEVAAEDADQRLDRWFRKQFPDLTHGRLEKLLRTGQVRVDGGRVKANTRLAAGQAVRVPPLDAPEGGSRPAKPRASVTENDAKDLRKAILHQDDWLIVLNKPAGLATQGGTGLTRHLDAMLDGLKRHPDDERPRLVHRLDKDTSGVLVLARTARAAKALTEAFRIRETRKLYWALVVGTPKPRAGTIRAALAKEGGAKGERMVHDDVEGKPALTEYQVVDDAAGTVSWVCMEPRTGRTHQLRAHALVLGTPILGDGKYGAAAAFVGGAEVARQMHLHARLIALPHPAGGVLTVEAPLPRHMTDAFKYFGFQPGEAPGLEDMHP
ncbi:RluA family pseudouridine synthase [Roseospira marina]|uniref:Pseudouridine synthase n=1 Tax=Roseospira marina TaxID=140057 RepID=A0A5M6IHD8_9PROT|nr:RluA family pseudouridine synthase [Roseospira marina]KAA5607644.1 RluA family pseudouridine synthase [Roseospira marina]MBB4312155.1 23S rRNA pseudouridine955/2504/2580 synthase [Roseospira marina]MBB5085829.1 23S rRNA pseudouridine955/2504/2580 synthase [Roseospira marina]